MTGPQRNFEDLWGAADPSLPPSLSLCFIIKDDFSIQQWKHIEKFCTATPTGDRRVGRGRAMDEGRVTYQFSGQYFNKQNARDASGARRKHREGQRITLLIAKKKAKYCSEASIKNISIHCTTGCATSLYELRLRETLPSQGNTEIC